MGFREEIRVFLFCSGTRILRMNTEVERYDKVLREMGSEPDDTPADLEERIKRWFLLLEAVRTDLKPGAFTGWGLCNDASEGCCLVERDEKTLHAMILKYIPHLIFDITPVLTIDQSINNVTMVATAAKK
jgi:hypothetical protein